MSEGEAGNPWVAALTSFLTFGIGALLPIIPWFFVGGWPGVILGAIFSAGGLFLLGAAITPFTGLGVLYSGTRQTVLGLAAAVITYVIGSLVGASTGI